MELMDRSVMMRAGVGALLIGAGLALMLSASKKICVDCEKGEAALEDVAAASAEMATEELVEE